MLWPYRVTVKMPTGETPFTLTYGHKVMPPVEIEISSYRIQHFEQESNDKQLEEQLVLLEEVRIEVGIRTATNKRRVERCFNKHVRLITFKVGDLVLKETRTIMQDEGKLGPRWEGPCVVTATNRSGSYRLNAPSELLYKQIDTLY